MTVGPAFARTARHFFPDRNSWLDDVPDPRRQDRVVYHRRSLRWYGVLLFAGQLGSRRQLDFKYRENGTCALGDVHRLARTDQDTGPGHDTLDDYLAVAETAPVARVRAQLRGRLIRRRAPDPGRVQGRLVVGSDGSGYLVFRWRPCDHGLTRRCGGVTVDCHPVLEAKVLGPAQTALSRGTEFLDNRHLDDVPADAGAGASRAAS